MNSLQISATVPSFIQTTAGHWTSLSDIDARVTANEGSVIPAWTSCLSVTYAGKITTVSWSKVETESIFRSPGDSWLKAATIFSSRLATSARCLGLEDIVVSQPVDIPAIITWHAMRQAGDNLRQLGEATGGGGALLTVVVGLIKKVLSGAKDAVEWKLTASR